MHFGRSNRDPKIPPADEAAAEAHMAIASTDTWAAKRPVSLTGQTPREMALMLLSLQGPLEEAKDEHEEALRLGNHAEVARLAADVHYWTALGQSWREDLEADR
jgi:hypothetical protein